MSQGKFEEGDLSRKRLEMMLEALNFREILKLQNSKKIWEIFFVQNLKLEKYLEDIPEKFVTLEKILELKKFRIDSKAQKN